MSSRETMKRLSRIRGDLLREFPFFGRILLQMRYGFAPCSTAATNGEMIIFDPDFAGRISDQEMKFILLHECYHCVLHHVSRARYHSDKLRYNVAADIVINSMILLNVPSFPADMKIDGSPVMHLAPDGNEGYLYTTEEVLEQLKDENDTSWETLDDHCAWETISAKSFDYKWNRIFQDTLTACEKGGSAVGLAGKEMTRQIERQQRSPKIDWKKELRVFMHRMQRKKEYDFSYMYPDRRFPDSDIIIPGWCEEEIHGHRIDQIWILCDVSGSISDEALGTACDEIANCLHQLPEMTGCISFFDHKVYEPIPFSKDEKPVFENVTGGGGTNFFEIFRSMEEYFDKTARPKGIVIVTDGLANYPEESAAQGIPVLWVLVESPFSDLWSPPWGNAVYIDDQPLTSVI